MTRRWLGCGMLTVLYLATGLFVVPGNEQALVRRFGRARLPLAASGLHFDLPWPMTRIDRLNVHESRVLSIGLSGGPVIAESGFLRDVRGEREGEFLTGDKNILNLQVNVQYRVADPSHYLFSIESPELGLRLCAESLVADVVSRSGVDFVHPLGLDQLREILTREVQTASQTKEWGLAIDDVTITSVLPPVEVKAAFLDVSNARAEKERVISLEQSRREQQVSAASAMSRQKLDRALSDQHTRVSAAKGAADRFTRIIAEFDRESETGLHSRDTVRRLAMRRLLANTMEEILSKLSANVVVDSTQPSDLTIFPGRNSPAETTRPIRDPKAR